MEVVVAGGWVEAVGSPELKKNLCVFCPRKQEQQRKKEYQQEIREMHRRVKGRPLLLEQVAQVSDISSHFLLSPQFSHFSVCQCSDFHMTREAVIYSLLFSTIFFL